jgi:hypothetical protein
VSVPPDLEEVTLELPLREITQALLPFLGEAGSPSQGSPPPTGSFSLAEKTPNQIVLEISPKLARSHIPSLLPSIRGLSGGSVFPTSIQWLRESYQQGMVRYPPRNWEPVSESWRLRVVSVGGLAGATLFLRDQDAERVRSLLASTTPPSLLVVTTSATNEAAHLEVTPPATDLPRKTHPLSPPLPPPAQPHRWKTPARPAPPSTSKEVTRTGGMKDILPPLAPPPSTEELISPDSSRTASPPAPPDRPQVVRKKSDPSSELANLLANFRARARRRDLVKALQAVPEAQPPAPFRTLMTREDLENLPSEPEETLDRLLYHTSPSRGQEEAPPTPKAALAAPRTRSVPEDGELPAIPPTQSPAIRWQFFRAADEGEGELP